MFKVHKVNLAPTSTGIKTWQASIHVSEHGSDLRLGGSCVTKEEFEALKASLIKKINGLKFPAS